MTSPDTPAEPLDESRWTATQVLSWIIWCDTQDHSWIIAGEPARWKDLPDLTVGPFGAGELTAEGDAFGSGLTKAGDAFGRANRNLVAAMATGKVVARGRRAEAPNAPRVDIPKEDAEEQVCFRNDCLIADANAPLGTPEGGPFERARNSQGYVDVVFPRDHVAKVWEKPAPTAAQEFKLKRWLIKKAEAAKSCAAERGIAKVTLGKPEVLELAKQRFGGISETGFGRAWVALTKAHPEWRPPGKKSEKEKALARAIFAEPD